MCFNSTNSPQIGKVSEEVAGSTSARTTVTSSPATSPSGTSVLSNFDSCVSVQSSLQIGEAIGEANGKSHQCCLPPEFLGQIILDTLIIHGAQISTLDLGKQHASQRHGA